MAARFVSIDRDTPMLLPTDLRDWVPEDDLVHFVLEAAQRLPTSNFRINHRGSGNRQFPPHMMLALLIYCYTNGRFSSRAIEQATYRDLAVRYLCANTHPDHDTICRFRSENLPAFQEAFVNTLELARELKLLKMGTIALDGTHLKANASIDKNITYQRASQIREQLRLDVQELIAQAQQADLQDDQSQHLPPEIARREALAAKMDRAMEQLQARAQERQETALTEYEEKMEKRRQHQEQTGKKHGGTPPIKPAITPQKRTDQCNLSDPDSRIMRKNKRSSFTQSYNAQALVEADGSQLIVGQYISQCPNDSQELEKGVASIPAQLGLPQTVLTDAGYINAEAFERLDQKGVAIYCSVHREDAHSERQYDYRPPLATQRALKEVTDPRLVAMAEKLRSPEGKAIYAKRNQSVEPVFGIIKEAMGFRGFRLRGKEKVAGEWTLVCLAYNLRRLHRLMRHRPSKRLPRGWSAMLGLKSRKAAQFTRRWAYVCKLMRHRQSASLTRQSPTGS